MTARRHISWLMWGNEPLGGVRTALSTFAEALRAGGWRVSVICLDEGELAEALRASGFEVICLDRAGNRHARHVQRLEGRFGRVHAVLDLLGFRDALLAALKQLRPDVLSLYWPLFLFLAGPLARRLQLPLAWELPEVPSVQRFRLNQRAYATLLRLWRVQAIANSQFTAERLGPVPRLQIVYPPSEARRFDPARVQAWRRETLGLPADALLLGSIARLSPQKCGESLIAALSLLPSSAPRLDLLFVGGPTDSDYAARLRQRVRDAGLESRVHFLGGTPDTAPAHALMDLFVSCRPDPEGFGLSIVEAMLSAKPVLARALGGPAETVVDGVTGWHIHDDAPESIATALRRALAEQAQWQAFGQRGRQRALDHFCVEQSVPAYTDCLDRHIQAIRGRP